MLIGLFVCLFVCFFICLFLCLFVCLFVCLFISGKGSLDKANEELRTIIRRIWPKTSAELLDRVVLPPGGGEEAPRTGSKVLPAPGDEY